jgi:hypothetical protein
MCIIQGQCNNTPKYSTSYIEFSSTGFEFLPLSIGRSFGSAVQIIEGTETSYRNKRAAREIEETKCNNEQSSYLM